MNYSPLAPPIPKFPPPQFFPEAFCCTATKGLSVPRSGVETVRGAALHPRPAQRLRFGRFREQEKLPIPKGLGIFRNDRFRSFRQLLGSSISSYHRFQFRDPALQLGAVPGVLLPLPGLAQPAAHGETVNPHVIEVLDQNEVLPGVVVPVEVEVVDVEAVPKARFQPFQGAIGVSGEPSGVMRFHRAIVTAPEGPSEAPGPHPNRPAQPWYPMDRTQRHPTRPGSFR